MSNSEQTPIKLEDFGSEAHNPNRKTIIILSSFIGVVALFFISIIGLNWYVYVVRVPPQDSNITYSKDTDSASDEIEYVDQLSSVIQDQNIESILGARLGEKEVEKTSTLKEYMPSDLKIALSKSNKRSRTPLVGTNQIDNSDQIPNSSIGSETPRGSQLESLKTYLDKLVKEKGIKKEPSNKAMKTTKYTNEVASQEKQPAEPEENFFVYRDYSVSKFVPGESKHIAVPITTTLKAVLLTDLNSVAPPNTVIARIVETTSSSRALKGCTVLGQMKADVVTKRLFINFSELILADNRRIKIDAIAQDENGRDGLSALVNNNMGNDLLKEGFSRGMDVLQAYVGLSSSLNDISRKKEDEINTDIVLTLRKNETIKLFFQQHVEI